MFRFIIPGKSFAFSVFLMFCFCMVTKAQIFDTTSYPFTVLTDGVLDDMTGASVALGSNVINTPSALIAFPSGFTFKLGGTLYSGFSASPDGWARLGSAGTIQALDNLASTQNYPIIAPYWSDMQTTTGGGVKYKITGTVPYRKFTIQWIVRNSLFPSSGVKFQLWLWESSGRMEFVYYSLPVNSNTYSVGFGATNFTGPHFASITTSSPAINSTVSYSSANGANTIAILPGTVFRFRPDTITPGLPNNFYFNPVEARCMTFNWTDSSTTETYFELFRSADSINFAKIAVVNSSTTNSVGTTYSYLDSALLHSTVYYYKIAPANFGSVPDTTTICSHSTGPPMISGLKTIPGDYNSISEVMDEIRCKLLAGDLVLELQSNYNSAVEPMPIRFVDDFFTGPGKTITVRPATNAAGIILSSAGSVTMRLSKSKYITIDGRPGGTGSGNEITICNTSTSGTAIQFINDASYNTVKYCTVMGLNNSSTSGVIVFSTTIHSSGNDSNLIDHCNLRDTISFPLNIIYSKGTTGKDNSGNTISVNNIYNFYKGTISGSCNGILLDRANSEWTITGNSFYETAPRMLRTPFHAINIANGMGNGFIISNNYIGGSGPLCSGPPLTLTTGSGANLNLVGINAGNTAPTEFYGNTIKNIFFSNSLSTLGVLLKVDSGYVKIGDLGGNVFGSADEDSSIIITSTTSNGFIPVNCGSYDYVSIQNNTIGGIHITGPSGSFTGIFINNSDSAKIVNNIVGSKTVLNSIYNDGDGQMRGIMTNFIFGGPCIITDNIVANLTKTSTANNDNNNINGIAFYGGGISASVGYKYNVMRNRIFKLSSASSYSTVGNDGAYVAAGLYLQNEVENGSIADNEIYGISSSSTVDGIMLYGMYLHHKEGSFITVSNNFIHGISMAKGSACGIMMKPLGGVSSYRVINNMIRLGIGPNGMLDNQNYGTVGISWGSGLGGGGTVSVLFNSIYMRNSGTLTTGGSSAIGCYQLTGDSIMNNIIWNDRIFTGNVTNYENYCILTNNNPGTNLLVSDYNLFFADNPRGFIGKNYNQPVCETLGEWQSVTGHDMHSLYGNPLFINPQGDTSSVDLHVDITSPVESAGILLPGINNDFDFENRNSFTPVDIGADCINYFVTTSIDLSSTNANCFDQCDGTATVTITGNGEPYSILWDDLNSQSTETATGLCHGTYNVTVTDNMGESETGSITVAEPSVFDLTNLATNTSACGACDGSTSITIIGGVSPYTYLWSNESSNLNLTGLCAGLYSISVTDSTGCTITDSYTVSEPPSPSVNFTFVQGDPAINFTGSVSGGTPDYIYEWDFGDAGSDNVLSPSHTYAFDGTYNVNFCVTDDVGCTACDNQQLTILTTNIANGSAFNNLNIYPNPTTNKITIESEFQKCNYKLSDLSGKLLLTGSANTQKFELDLSGFDSGIYLLTLSDNEKQARKKIIKY